MNWKDTSSFSQNQRDRTPCTFEARVGVLRLTVTRHIHFDKDDWVMSCTPFINQVAITGNVYPEVAKQLAEQTLRDAFTKHVDLLGEGAE